MELIPIKGKQWFFASWMHGLTPKKIMGSKNKQKYKLESKKNKLKGKQREMESKQFRRGFSTSGLRRS